MKSDHRHAASTLHAYALSFPEAYEDHPWGETVMKVKKKVFVFMGHPGSDGFGLSVKLPRSGGLALMSPFASPTGYGLGKAGWVTCRFGPKDEIPVEILRDWIRESYRAVAPKKLADLSDLATEAADGAAARSLKSVGERAAKKMMTKKKTTKKKPAAARRRRRRR
jgi:predicted DNA-binding protein (MmcQ/YjbR family)